MNSPQFVVEARCTASPEEVRRRLRLAYDLILRAADGTADLEDALEVLSRPAAGDQTRKPDQSDFSTRREA